MAGTLSGILSKVPQALSHWVPPGDPSSFLYNSKNGAYFSNHQGFWEVVSRHALFSRTKDLFFSCNARETSAHPYFSPQESSGQTVSTNQSATTLYDISKDLYLNRLKCPYQSQTIYVFDNTFQFSKNPASNNKRPAAYFLFPNSQLVSSRSVSTKTSHTFYLECPSQSENF